MNFLNKNFLKKSAAITSTVVILTVLSSVATAQEQILTRWLPKTPMQVNRTQMAVASNGRMVYLVTGGTQTEFSADLMVYDSSSDSWSFRQPAPTPRTVASAQILGGKLYVFGGYFRGLYPTALEIYDPATGQWTTGQQMPTGRAGAASGAVIGKLYVIGGDQAGTPMSVVEAYNPTTGAWEARSPMPTPRTGPASAVVGEKIYVIGGGGQGGGTLNTVEVYDPAKDSWERKNPMPVGRTFALTSAAALNEKIYVVGGWNGGGLAAVHKYDPATDSWTDVTPLPAPRAHHAVAAANGFIYVFGGFDASQSPLNTVLALAPSEGAGAQPPPAGTQTPAPETQPSPGAVVATCSRQCQSRANDCFKNVQNQEAANACFSQLNDCLGSCKSQQPPPSGAGEGFSGAPGFEDGQEKFGAEFSEKAKAYQKKFLNQIKRQLSGVSRQLGTVKKFIADAQKKGVTPPPKLIEAVASIENLVAKIKAADSIEDIMELDAQETMQDAFQTIEDELPNLIRLMSLPKIYARIDRQIAQLERQLAADKKLAQKTKIDLSSEVTEFDAALTKLKNDYAAAKAKIAAGDDNEGFAMLEERVFDAFDEVAQNHINIQQISRLRAVVLQIEREIRRSELQLNKFKKKNANLPAAQSALFEAKAALTVLKALAAAKPLDAEAVFDQLDKLKDIRDRFEDALEDLQGISEKKDIDAGLLIPSVQVPNLQAFGF